MISAKIICDSLSPQGHRITTFELVFPRFILAELNTHRLFSKNSASSRAIPFNKMVKAVQENPFIPMAWQKEHKGMQGTEYASYPDTEDFKVLWLEAIDNAVKSAQLLQTGDVKLTKQLCNRLLEPFMYHKVLLTATEFDNFFELRCPQYTVNVEGASRVFRSKEDLIAVFGKQEDMTDEYFRNINKGQSEIHMMQLAECMWDAMNESVPKQLKAGEYHIPYGDETNNQAFTNFKMERWKNIQVPSGDSHIDLLLKISTAKCAKTSYTTVGEDGKEIPYEKDIALHDSLIASGHFSPTEHCSRAMSNDEYYADFVKFENGEKKVGWCLNYRGFIQYRYLLQNQ